MEKVNAMDEGAHAARTIVRGTIARVVSRRRRDRPSRAPGDDAWHCIFNARSCESHLAVDVARARIRANRAPIDDRLRSIHTIDHDVSRDDVRARRDGATREENHRYRARGDVHDERAAETESGDRHRSRGVLAGAGERGAASTSRTTRRER